MSNDRDQDQGRSETTPFGRRPDWPAEGPPRTGSTAAGQQPGQSPYEQPGPTQPFGSQPYGSESYGSESYGNQPYGTQQYGQPAPYAQPGPYGQQGPYGQPAPHGSGGPGRPPVDLPRPARPGTVITAAVLGLLHAGLGLLTTVLLIAGGTLFDDLADAVSESDPTIDQELGTAADGVQAVFLLFALLALSWTVVMVWGSVLALRGRSRVLLLVGSSIAVASTGLALLFVLVAVAAEPGEEGQVGAVLVFLALFLAALAMLVLLCLRSAAQFYAAHRQRRALTGS